MSQDGKEFNADDMIEILVACKNELGDNIGGKTYVPIPRKEGDRGVRIEFFKQVIHNLKENGYSKEAIKGSQFFDILLKASHNPRSDHAKSWKELVTQDWEDATWSFFGRKVSTYDSSNDPKPPEREKYQKPEPVEPSIELENPLDPNMETGIAEPGTIFDESLIDDLFGSAK
jgi:hypothetical protein